MARRKSKPRKGDAVSETAPTIFVTGAASGIGRQTARLFAQKGWRVGLADRNAAALEAVARECCPNAKGFVVDVLELSQLTAALSAFSGSGGALKALFNSAGILEMKPFAETDVARLQAIVDINVKGVINSISAALPFLKAHGDARIVTMDRFRESTESRTSRSTRPPNSPSAA